MAEIKSLTLFITHYQTMARMAEQFDGELRNVHMKFTEQQGEGGEDITFLYEVGEGVAHRSYGLNVAKLAGLPKTLIDEAGRQSSQMELAEGRRRLGYLSKTMSELLARNDAAALEHLVAGVNRL